MPLIEFHCPKCESEFEELVLRTDDLRSIRCPKCTNKNLERLYSTFGFRSNSGFSGNIGSSCTSCAKDTCHGCSK